jgi:hypothetical protein
LDQIRPDERTNLITIPAQTDLVLSKHPTPIRLCSMTDPCRARDQKNCVPRQPSVSWRHRLQRGYRREAVGARCSGRRRDPERRFLRPS